MSLFNFFQIFFVCLLGAMSPGPSMVVVINNAIFKNRYNGILTSIGHGIGIGIYAFLAVVRVGFIIKTNIIIFNGIKIISIFFLIYMGIKSILNKKNLDFGEGSKKNGLSSFIQGLIISILNPKIFIWFVAIYSQFMSSENDFVFNSYLVFTASIVDATWYIFLTFIVTSDIVLRFLKNKSIIIHRIIGVLFIIISAILLIDIIK